MRILRIIGGESTGKSTLATTLANELGGILVPEMARIYLEHRASYEQEDLWRIAELQCEEEFKAFNQSPSWMVCDTDLHVIQVWSEYKYNNCSLHILNHLSQQAADLYVVCGADIPWQFDPLRENPDPLERNMFERWYAHLAESTGKPFLVVRGTEPDRLQQVHSLL